MFSFSLHFLAVDQVRHRHTDHLHFRRRLSNKKSKKEKRVGNGKSIYCQTQKGFWLFERFMNLTKLLGNKVFRKSFDKNFHLFLCGIEFWVFSMKKSFSLIPHFQTTPTFDTKNSETHPTSRKVFFALMKENCAVSNCEKWRRKTRINLIWPSLSSWNGGKEVPENLLIQQEFSRSPWKISFSTQKIFCSWWNLQKFVFGWDKRKILFHSIPSR